MEKIIHTLIDSWTKGVDTYTHNSSTWLIFTESKQWVIELTEGKTLWYNYNFFRQIFDFTSLDVVDNQQYITKWVEDNIINKVNNIRFRDARDNKHQFEDTLKNGVKRTMFETIPDSFLIEDTIHNGVKDTRLQINITEGEVEEIIENGAIHTEYGDWLDGDERLDDIVENGVKETNHVDVMNFFDNKMEDTLNNGVKETKISPTHTEYGDWLDGDERLDEIIKNGEKINGTYAGGQRQSEKCKSVVEYGTKNPSV